MVVALTTGWSGHRPSRPRQSHTHVISLPEILAGFLFTGMCSTMQILLPPTYLHRNCHCILSSHFIGVCNVWCLPVVAVVVVTFEGRWGGESLPMIYSCFCANIPGMSPSLSGTLYVWPRLVLKMLPNIPFRISQMIALLFHWGWIIP